MALTECLQSVFPNRKICLVITLTATLFLPIAAITWNKLPPNPVNGILGENVTLEWNFTLTAAEVFDYFALLRKSIDMAKYSENVGVVIYPPYDANYVRVGNGTSSFVLINLTRHDDGATYCCKVGTKTAGNQRGTIKQECTKLNISVRPAIESFSNNQTVNETGDVTLSCNATGKPIPSVEWSKADDANETLSTSSILPLTNISREQDGFYRCTADNGLGKVVASVRIIVHYEPSITAVTESYNVTEGRDLELRCSSDGRPRPTVTWSKAGLANITYPPGHRLKIKNVNRTEDGVYICTAANGIGKIANAKMDVNVFYPPGIVAVESNQAVTLNETQDLRLVCIATGNPQPLIQWSKSTRPGQIKSVDGVLTVENVSKTDAGSYECRASNGIGSDATSLSTVTVNYRPSGTNLTTNATKNMAIEGLSVAFFCSSDSVPPSVYELRFKGLSLDNSSNGIFTIREVRASHQGTYGCAARNILGIGPVATVNLDVLRPPSIDVISHNATANETDDVMLLCNATGNPHPNITWTSLIDPVPKVVRTGNTLTLSNVTRDQAGTYQCTATNGLISAKTASIYVTINYKPEIRDETSHEVLSWQNHETQIRCEATGMPLPEIEWNRSGTVTTYTQSHSRASILTFTPKEEIDFGLYSCTARNLLGSTTLKMTVVMLDEPEAPKTLRIEPGFDHLEIHWSESTATNPAGSVLDYLAQVREKDEPEGWRNCTQRNQSHLTCVINGLESGTLYIVRVAGRNVVGYSEFKEKKVQTKTIDDDYNDDNDGNEGGEGKDDEGKPDDEDEPKETGKHERQQSLPGYTIDAIIAGVIGFSSLVVMIVAIVMQRGKCLQEKANYKVNKSSRKSPKVEANGHDNNAFVENQGNDETEAQV